MEPMFGIILVQFDSDYTFVKGNITSGFDLFLS